MLYQSLKTVPIQLGAGAVLQWDCKKGVVLKPQTECKLFAHWHSEQGKLRSTYTITDTTRLEGLVLLTNALDKETQFEIIHLD